MLAKEKRGITGGAGIIQTLIGQGSEFEGTIKTDTLRIEGIFKGTIQSAKQVVIGSSGHVIGDIHAEELLIAGNMQGNTYISRRLELGSTGVLDGDINTDVLVMEEGAAFRGNCKTGKLEKQEQKNTAAKNTVDKK